MSMVACPFCYYGIDTRKLWFRCAGRGSPAKKGCERVKDKARERVLGDATYVLPSFDPGDRKLRTVGESECPDCGGLTRIRVCPTCHSPTPASLGSGANPLIATIGAKNTGKTVFLQVLSNELRGPLIKRFDADIRLTGDHQFKANGSRSRQLFANRDLGEKTETAVNGRRLPTVFEWRRERRIPPRYQTSYLSFFDTAGEDLISQEGTGGLRYLRAADALILLLDPFMIPQARDQVRLPTEALGNEDETVDVVNRVTEHLRIEHGIKGSRSIPIPIAVAFAKIDAFFDVLGEDHPLVRRPPQGAFYDDEAGRATHEHVRALLHQWGAEDIDVHLRHNYKTFRYFAISSLGAQPDYRTGLVDERGVQPFRVEEPLLWLLQRYGVVPGREARW